MMLAAIYHPILGFFFLIVAALLMIVILLQRGRGVGLAGAFGGTGGHTAFGAKTGDMLTWVTIVGAGILLLFAILLNYVFRPGKPTLGAGAAGTTTPNENQTPANPPAGSQLPGSSEYGGGPFAADFIFGESQTHS